MEEKKDNFRHILRIGGVDLNGDKKIINELRRIKGVSFLFANALCNAAGIERNKKVGYLEDNDVMKIEQILKDPLKFNIPSWLLNRRADPEEGINMHKIGADLKFTQENDIRFLKKIRCYRGIRHSLGLPVRGQRTKSNFRKNKGKVMGVAKTKEAKAAAMAEKKEMEKKGKA